MSSNPLKIKIKFSKGAAGKPDPKSADGKDRATKKRKASGGQSLDNRNNSLEAVGDLQRRQSEAERDLYAEVKRAKTETRQHERIRDSNEAVDTKQESLGKPRLVIKCDLLFRATSVTLNEIRHTQSIQSQDFLVSLSLEVTLPAYSLKTMLLASERHYTNCMRWRLPVPYELTPIMKMNSKQLYLKHTAIDLPPSESDVKQSSCNRLARQFKQDNSDRGLFGKSGKPSAAAPSSREPDTYAKPILEEELPQKKKKKKKKHREADGKPLIANGEQVTYPELQASTRRFNVDTVMACKQIYFTLLHRFLSVIDLLLCL